MISCICVTGSTEINSHVRADLLWRMVNSMHENPGHPFELILVDNCHGPSLHRKAIDDIFETWRTVTHVVRNRQNCFHGGGVNQGVALADGDIIVLITDDLEWKPGWLRDLILPLVIFGSMYNISAPLKGHNCRSDHIDFLEIEGKKYQSRTNAAAYCWAFYRKLWDKLGPWKRAHFADTRWSICARNLGCNFILPTWKIAVETNLNYLRPWDYKKEKRLDALTMKKKRIEGIFQEGKLMARAPERPLAAYPLKNPRGIGPGAYPEEWLREQGVVQKEAR